MRKLNLFFLLFIAVLTLTACDPAEEIEACSNGQIENEKGVCVDPELEKFTVTFNSDGGSAIVAQEVEIGTTATLPTEPTKEGYVFVMWYSTDSTVEFAFTTPITEDITLSAFWVEDEPTNEELIQEDYEAILETIIVSPYLLDLPSRGPVNRSRISWSSESLNISSSGVVLPLAKDATATTAEITATIKFLETEVEYTFDIPLTPGTDVVIDTMVNVPFENLTTEYEVEDGTLDLYFEEDGSVPYVKLTEFFDLVDGFIDPTTVFTVSTVEGVLTIEYQYYDEDEDYTYDLILTVDATENTIDVNDPGFYWAYVYSTETNYGRHIEYVQDHPEESYDEGDNILYDLDGYNMDIVEYQGEVLLPYFIANQLFVGSSYYNVYYNGDGLYGIYSLPRHGSDEFTEMNSSSLNGKDIPVDLVIHTFNMLAFNLDYMYGLKDILDVETYYDLLLEQRNKLLTQDAQDLDEGLSYLMFKKIAEPHTNYGYHSYYNGSYYSGPEVYISDLGGRHADYYDGRSDVEAVISSKFNSVTGGENVWNRPYYWFLDDVSAMITLDDFNTADIEVSYTYDKTLVEGILDVTDANTILPTVSEGSKFWHYNNSSEENVIYELIVKDVDQSYVTTYETALLAKGAILVTDGSNTEDGKENGYYSLTVGDTTYMILVSYDTTFDAFYIGVTDEVPVDYSDEWVLLLDVDYTVYSDSSVYFELVLEQIVEEKPLVENITVDLTWNGGGNVGALFRLFGFITDEPFANSGISRDTNGTSTSFVDIDAGIPSYAHLDWSLLISPVTFSAANSMSTIFQANDLGPVIGVQSGGGACSITPILLPNGSAFTMSSNNIEAYRTGTGTTEDPYVYHNVEFGIVPDHVLNLSKLFDEAELLAIINPTD